MHLFSPSPPGTATGVDGITVFILGTIGRRRQREETGKQVRVQRFEG
jgi:hypothetical protein